MNEEATLVIIKPDGIKKSLTGDVLSRLSQSQLKIIGAKAVKVSREIAEKHYGHLSEKPFFSELIRYIRGELHGENRVLAMIYYGEGAIKKIRDIAGATNPEEAYPITIRGAYGRILTSGLFENVIHASSSSEDAEKEIKLWFEPEEVVYDLYPCDMVVKEKVEKKVWV